MKIIGKTTGSSGYDTDYLVRMTADEMAHICGFSHHSNEDFGKFLDEHRARNRENGIIDNAEIPVSDWWRRLTNIRAKELELQKLADTLRGLADLVASTWPIITDQIEKVAT